jgi:hydroxyquinol 1,2-dioxygenase
MRNLNENNITDEVVRRMVDTPNPRLKEIMNGLVRHLHAFARETKLTEEEWLASIEFLTRTGHACHGQRQEFILLSDTLGLSQLVVAQSHSRPSEVTEQTVFGPFHVPGAPKLPSHGGDIGKNAKGEPCLVTARVMSSTGAPLTNCMVDVWQADAAGFYDVQDPGWNPDSTSLRAIFETGADGRFSFWTIMPKSYPIPVDGPVGEMMRATKRHPMRPAHIHFMVKKSGYDALVTHVFVDGDEYLDSDAVFGVRSSCIGNYVRHDAGIAPDGKTVSSPFYTLDYTFSMQALPASISSAAE